ncbi:hypothetical protein [Bradyrhizobium lablabi]|uniref:hypothetical protein n=1 Tax=Bradyrhizobium lablabi TaxID=722472 RepID=UPI001BA7C5A4|nr:hypothetical protein [Bradyrhizobium lablabi]MBR0696988.1 hypothetical protein [Bradyrhizobium lablabi]
MKPWLALFILFITVGTATSEPFSIQCEAGNPPKVYYSTFDPDSKRVVFESASPANLYSGEIVEVGDHGLEVALRVHPGRLHFIWDSAAKRVVWPGISDDPFRPWLSHPCRAVEARSILSFREATEILNPASIRCDTPPAESRYTFDTASAKVLLQRQHGPSYDGKIDKVEGDRVRFRLSDSRLSEEQQKREMVWDRSGRTLSIEGVPGDPSRPAGVWQCEQIKSQTMLEYYDTRW